MLSAFAARPIIELKQRDKSKIETILAYGTSLPAHRASCLPLTPCPQATACLSA
jgi:hypothetical protein